MRLRRDGAGGEAVQGLHHELRADVGRGARKTIEGGLVAVRWECSVREQHGAGVQAFVDAHGGDAGDRFAVGDGPLDGRGAAIFRQQRAVQVDVPSGGRSSIQRGMMRP